MEQAQAVTDQSNYPNEEVDNSSTVQVNVNTNGNVTSSGKNMTKGEEYDQKVVVVEEREEQQVMVNDEQKAQEQQIQYQMQQQPPPIIMTTYGDQHQHQQQPFYQQQPVDKLDGTASNNSSNMQLFSFGIPPHAAHPHHLNPNAAAAMHQQQLQQHQQHSWNAHHLNPPVNANPNSNTAVIQPMNACYPPPPGMEAQVLQHSPTSPAQGQIPLQVPVPIASSSMNNLTATTATNTTTSPASSTSHHQHYQPPLHNPPPHPHHQHQHHHHPIPHPNMLMTQHHPHHDPLEIILGVFPCVHLRNLPFEANIDDVLIFFQGLVMLDVLVCCYFGNHNNSHINKNGVFRGNGEAFVIFANPIDFQMALQRDRQRLGRRCIEVNQGKRVDYYAAIASQYYRRNNYHNHNNNYNHSKNHDGNNIPNMNQNNLQSNPSWNNNPNNNANATPTTAASTTQSDSNDQSSTTSSNINNSANRKGKVQHQQQAYRDNNGNYHFNNHAGYHKNHYQQHHHNQPNNYNNINGGAGTQLTEHTGYLRLRGLPYASTVPDIQCFFANYELVESTIAFTFKSDGRATGEAYVEFSSPEDSHKAMLGMHRKIMGNRYIEIFISFKEEHARALVRFQNR